MSSEIVSKEIGKIDLKNQAFIDGKYCPAISGKTFDCISPIDGKKVTEIAECGKEDIDRAVNAAKKVFEKGSWSRTGPSHRKKILIRFSELIKKNFDELSLLETIDMGKPIKFSQDDIKGVINCIRWYGEAIDKIYDEIAPTNPGTLALMNREPLGVIGAVTPWNFPLAMAAWKMGPALATGNSMVLKPAEQSPLTAIRIGELAVEAGIPEGVFNVVPGDGPNAGKALGMHMDVNKIAFTGSAEVGKFFLQYAGLSNMKSVSLECGGKSANIIFSDAPNLDFAINQAAWGIFYNSGQVCDAASRLVIDEKIKDEFLEKIINLSKEIKPTNPLDPGTTMGSMVDEIQTDRVMKYIDIGKQEGAKVVLGGKQVNQNTGGFYIEPTIFDNVKNDMKVAQEEIFGPVLSTITFRNEEEAATIGNETVYGLQSAVWTKDINKAHRIAKSLRSGKVMINTWDGGDITTSHGGFKQSGFGVDKSLHAIDKYTQLKLTWIAIDSSNSNGDSN